MKRRAAEDQAKRYYELKRQIAGRTDLPDDSPRLDYLAMLWLQMDRVRARMIHDDDNVSAAELLALQNAVTELSPEPTHNVNIQVCRTLTGICPLCHGQIDLGEPNGQPQHEPPPGPRLLPPPSACV
jgi:hypothetical protein